LLRKERLSTPQNPQLGWGISRELAMVSGMFILAVLAAVVVLGTLYPIASEMLLGVKVNVQAPYFNAFAPWFGAALALLMALGALLRYHSKKLVLSKQAFIILVALSLLTAITFAKVSDVFASHGFRFSIQLIGSWLVFFTIYSQIADLICRYQPLRAISSKTSNTPFTYLVFFKKNLTYIGSVLAHLGFLIAILGFLGNYSAMKQSWRLNEKDVVSFMGYDFEYLGMDTVTQDNATLFRATIALKHKQVLVDVLSPARSSYPTKKELLHEVDVRSAVWHDIYLVLANIPEKKGGAITLQIYYNPLVKLVWLSLVFMVLGVVVIFLGRRGSPSPLLPHT
ncbi:MAG: hypothetical protein OXC40_08110, partial [Proteobacteria bacterium]|nr:hypothetical protein [Pseudomonadota bacterium]